MFYRLFVCDFTIFLFFMGFCWFQLKHLIKLRWITNDCVSGWWNLAHKCQLSFCYLLETTSSHFTIVDKLNKINSSMAHNVQEIILNLDTRIKRLSIKIVTDFCEPQIKWYRNTCVSTLIGQFVRLNGENQQQIKYYLRIIKCPSIT